MFAVTGQAIDPRAFREQLLNDHCGAYVAFEGWIRDHNEGQQVLRLEYEVYRPLAVSEGQKVLQEATEQFEIQAAACIHREGLLELGDIAVIAGVVAAHRADAFAACRFLIDEVKHRLPIWKKEHYANGTSGWINCTTGAVRDAGSIGQKS